jgi:HSP20 family protein
VLVPHKDLDELQQQVRELLGDLWQLPRFTGMQHGFRPQADCYRTDDPPAIHVVVELPGVDPEHVRLVVDGQSLFVSGVRERPFVPGSKVRQLELEHGPFERRLPLGESVDTGAATASLDRGLLRVNLPVAGPPVRRERVAIVIRRIG